MPLIIGITITPIVGGIGVVLADELVDTTNVADVISIKDIKDSPETINVSDSDVDVEESGFGVSNNFLTRETAIMLIGDYFAEDYQAEDYNGIFHNLT
jgi:hypothetical protein